MFLQKKNPQKMCWTAQIVCRHTLQYLCGPAGVTETLVSCCAEPLLTIVLYPLPLDAGICLVISSMSQASLRLL